MSSGCLTSPLPLPALSISKLDAGAVCPPGRGYCGALLRRIGYLPPHLSLGANGELLPPLIAEAEVADAILLCAEPAGVEPQLRSRGQQAGVHFQCVIERGFIPLLTVILALLAVGLFKPRQLDSRLVMLIPDPRRAHHRPVAAKIRMRAGVIAVNILPGGVDQRVRQHDLR